MTPATLREACRTAAAVIAGAGVKHAALDCFPLRAGTSEEYLAAVRQGLEEGAGDHALDIALLAPDAASFERMSRFVRA
jgi:hypothetical protein